MKFSVAKVAVSTLLLLSLAAIGKSAIAAEHEVTAVAVKYDPVFLYVEKGDTVTWTSMAGHNVETLEAMSPEGQEKLNTELGENVTAVFETEGIIVYKCTPHWGARMGGIVVVGKPDDPGAIIDAYLATFETDKPTCPPRDCSRSFVKIWNPKGCCNFNLS